MAAPFFRPRAGSEASQSVASSLFLLLLLLPPTQNVATAHRHPNSNRVTLTHDIGMAPPRLVGSGPSVAPALTLSPNPLSAPWRPLPLPLLHSSLLPYNPHPSPLLSSPTCPPPVPPYPLPMAWPTPAWLLLVHSVSLPSACGQRHVQGKIMGGTDAPEKKWPWQVSVHYAGFHICGGTIIHEYWILSAAHCFGR